MLIKQKPYHPRPAHLLLFFAAHFLIPDSLLVPGHIQERPLSHQGQVHVQIHVLTRFRELWVKDSRLEVGPGVCVVCFLSPQT